MQLDWNAVGALGQWAGAFATFSAVVLALWLDRRSRTTRLRLRVFPFTTKTDHGPHPDLVVVATNHSAGPIRLAGGGLVLPDGTDFEDALLAFSGKEAKQWQTATAYLWTAKLTAELAKRGITTTVKLYLYAEDETGRRHWLKYYFDPSKHPVLKATPKAPAPPDANIPADNPLSFPRA